MRNIPFFTLFRHIALLAARLMYDRTESEYFTAKRKAARQLGEVPQCSEDATHLCSR
jgi:hypothetical protein